MPRDQKKIISLLDFVKMDEFNVVCHFKCKITNKTIVSTVPFEPYNGKIEITLQDKILHPFRSYQRFYHTPITIYNSECHNTIVLKAFKKISSYFRWSQSNNCFIYMAKRN